MILESNPRIENGRWDMNKKSLIKRLEENDHLVKFVPFGFKTGEQTSGELGKNSYVVARYGNEGAEKIAEVADKYKKKPFLYAFDSVDEEKVRMSALDGFWGFGGRLGVDGDYWVGSGGGRSFGVLGG